MSRRVLKWDVPVDDKDHLVGGGKVVLVACQSDPGVVQVWTEEEPVMRNQIMRVYGTGQVVADDMGHVGSVVTADGRLVWHVYGRLWPTD